METSAKHYMANLRYPFSRTLNIQTLFTVISALYPCSLAWYHLNLFESIHVDMGRTRSILHTNLEASNLHIKMHSSYMHLHLPATKISHNCGYI
jgi:hypothetical protein